MEPRPRKAMRLLIMAFTSLCLLAANYQIRPLYPALLSIHMKTAQRYTRNAKWRRARPTKLDMTLALCSSVYVQHPESTSTSSAWWSLMSSVILTDFSREPTTAGRLVQRSSTQMECGRVNVTCCCQTVLASFPPFGATLMQFYAPLKL